MKLPWSKKPTNPRDFEQLVCDERCKHAAEFLRQLPHLPPNCDRLQIVFYYDDGRRLDVELGEK